MDRVAYGKRSQTHASTPLTPTSANPKAQPKSAVPNAKGAAAAKGSAKKVVSKTRKRGRAAKPKKTADELDAEMSNYWESNTAGGAANMADVNGSANPTDGAAAGSRPGGEDLGMDDISVSSSVDFIT